MICLGFELSIDGVLAAIPLKVGAALEPGVNREADPD
jgi:hypothetical protein